MLFKNTPYTQEEISLTAQQAITDMTEMSYVIEDLSSGKIRLRELLKLLEVLKTSDGVMKRTIKVIREQTKDLEKEFEKLKESVCIEVIKGKSKNISLMLDYNKDQKEICMCGSADDKDLIACEGSDCEIGWFHKRCVKLDDAEEDRWYCGSCRAKDT